MSPCSILGIGVLDMAGNRLFVQYYTETVPRMHAEQQRELELLVAEACENEDSGVVVCREALCVFEARGDVVFFCAGGPSVSELLLQSIVQGVCASLASWRVELDSQALVANYGLLCCAVDGAVDNGIVLSTEAVALEEPQPGRFGRVFSKAAAQIRKHVSR